MNLCPPSPRSDRAAARLDLLSTWNR